MGYNVGQIFTVSYRSRLFSQRILNIFHCRVEITTAQPPATELQALANYLADSSILLSPLELWKPLVAADFIFDEVRVQPISPASAAYKSKQINEVGTHADPCTASNIALSVSLRGDNATHHNAGRKQLAGVPTSAYANGIFTGAYLTMATPFGAACTGSFTVPATSATYRWCLADKSVPANYNDLTDSQPQPQVRTMHRRTVGLGE